MKNNKEIKEDKKRKQQRGDRSLGGGLVGRRRSRGKNKAGDMYKVQEGTEKSKKPLLNPGGRDWLEKNTGKSWGRGG